MRLGFDLHDGPIQDVLALAADVRLLQQQVHPFILDDYREQPHGRFDDLSSRLVELDRQLREIAHSLETKSVISRPLGEILHREVDSFAERTGIEAELEIRGDPDSLSSAQRITVFRAIQEALANVREHASATTVSVRVRARRSAIELQIVDDGMGFEVERALAKAAQRGRLGLVGIGERVRMVGGTFELESQPGGPTTLTFALAARPPGRASLAEVMLWNDERGGRHLPLLFALPTPHCGASDVGRGTRYGVMSRPLLATQRPSFRVSKRPRRFVFDVTDGSAA